MKQLLVPFKIYADFECNLKDVEVYEGPYTEKNHDQVHCSFAYKIVCIDNRFSKSIVMYRGKNAAYEQFLKNIGTAKKYEKTF